jgi:diguanylate cyclase (GGDEF)-like protein
MLLAVIVLVPLLIDRARMINTDQAERIEAANQQVLALARQGAEAQREAVISARAFLQAAAHAQATFAGSPHACDGFLADMAAHVSWKTFSVATPDGRVVCASPPEAVGFDISDRIYFQQALRTGTYVVSDYAVGRLNAEPMMVAVFPRRAGDGSIDAVLVGVFDAAWTARLAGTAARHKGAALLMVDGDGTVVTHHPQEDVWIGRQFKDHPLVRALLARPEGVVTENGLDGVRRVFGFVQLPGTETRLAVGLDKGEVLAPVTRETRYAYLWLGALGLTLLLAIWVGSDRLIVRPIRSLAHVAERFGRGQYDAGAMGQRWAAEFLPLVTAFDQMAAKIIARGNEARTMTERLSELATTDELSGLANRRAFESALAAEWKRAQMRDEPIALAMIDVDHFKAFNDQYGHLGGDDCLRILGSVFAGATRTDLDLAARYGGEEFALLLPGLDLRAATRVAERLRAAVADRGLPHVDTSSGCVTVSVGVASLRPPPGAGAHVLVEAADAALYAAKHRGRNTVVAHDAMTLSLAS